MRYGVKRTVDYLDVIKRLNSGEDDIKICKEAKVPLHIIKQIKGGRRVTTYFGKRKEVRIPPEKLCTCCGLRPKMPGNRFLCEHSDCNTYGGDDEQSAPANRNEVFNKFF